MKEHKEVELRTLLVMEMLPLATGFAESAAKAFGLDDMRSKRLGLAVEELFVFIAAQAKEGETMRLTARSGGYYVEIACFISPHSLPTRVMNRTAAANVEDEKFLEEMGILLTARMVDCFKLVMEQDKEMGLYFLVEKQYPEMVNKLSMPPEANYKINSGGHENLKQFAQQVINFYDTEAPDFFRFPGKVVDMVDSSEYETVVAVDDKGNVGGGMLWKVSGKLAEAYGPYVFKEGLAADLVEKVLEKLARSSVSGIVIRKPTKETPKGYFEELGMPVFKKVQAQNNTAMYRQLEEDTGMVVFVDSSLKDFVEKSYERLLLPRSIISVKAAGEKREAYSVFSVSVDKNQKQAVLSTLVVGEDAQNVLKEYIFSLKKQGFKDIFFELDTGKELESILAVDLKTVGFEPSFLLPCGGQGDIVVFEYEGGE
ncbi:hypothetical protein JMF89_07110 [Clostridiaceae bacterium UIB06]|uniref:Uncharacterized protein n=1 Tax=Clostridium thailandense TaxID=2794346 RepID=A0A949TV54_9CLOT|nr:ATP-binding protein [Clostridium thailandense]MBV7272446.1 hypothetical protein [Clostridium thailandense]MCH5136970.1 hypothetical protein [Clostridiaceae bacterium UIB06]